jgi:hypothetical protein
MAHFGFMRSELADIAKASRAKRTAAMDNFVKELFVAGLYASATQEEIEKFDELLDEMECAA